MDPEIKVKEVEKIEVEDKKKPTDPVQEDSSLMKFLRRHWSSIALLLYIVSPIDIIPDFLPMVGAADDVILLIFQILREYRNYKGSATQ